MFGQMPRTASDAEQYTPLHRRGCSCVGQNRPHRGVAVLRAEHPAPGNPSNHLGMCCVGSWPAGFVDAGILQQFGNGGSSEYWLQQGAPDYALAAVPVFHPSDLSPVSAGSACPGHPEQLGGWYLPQSTTPFIFPGSRGSRQAIAPPPSLLALLVEQQPD